LIADILSVRFAPVSPQQLREQDGATHIPSRLVPKALASGGRNASIQTEIMKHRTTASLLTLSIATVSLLLSGCGDKVLDYRNAQINNGKIYDGDGNTPFSGLVTNAPFNQVLMSQRGFGTAMQVFNAAIKGPALGLYNAALCDVHVRDGLPDGKAICKTPQSDVVRAEASFSDGTLKDTLTINDEDGKTVLTSVSFVDGQPDGKQEMRKPGTHTLVHVMHWDHGQLNGEEAGFDENTGNRILDANLVGGKLDGALIEYAPDGKQVIHHVKFVLGAKDGVEELFYPDTGKPRQYGRYVHGQVTGTAKAWDPDGRLVYERDYVNGNKIPDSPELIACIEHVINAVKDASDSAIGREDVARAMCREDKQANPGSTAQPVAQQVAPEIAALTAAAPAPAAGPSAPASSASRASAFTSDGPAEKRCGWIENDMPSGLTLKDRDGTWSISSADSQADGLSQMPDTNKGDSCGCLTIETNRQSMRVTKVLGGKILAVATCQRDRSLG
jgi:antitoxin component YwqK of YwqJK toxin-antitoxin module